MNKVKTGVPGLDELLEGGLPLDRNILVSGSCGSGKTTLAMQYIYNGVKEFSEPGIFITLEQSRKKIYEDALGFGWDIKELEKTGKFQLVGGPYSDLNRYMSKTKARIGDIVAEIKEIIEESGAKRVALDSLNLFTMLFPDPVDKRLALAELCNTLSSMSCTSMLTSEVNESSSELSRFGIEEYVTDGVIMLHYRMEESTFLQGLCIRKMRGTSHDRNIRPFTIADGKGIEVYPKDLLIRKKTSNLI